VPKPLLQIEDVTRAPENPRLVDWDLERPVPGGLEIFSFDLRGRIAAADGAVRWVRLQSPGQVVADAALDGDGAFGTPIGALALPRSFDVSARALLDGGPPVDLARIRGRRAPLRSPFEAHIQPLALTTFARTGSNYLVRLLGSHPEIVAYRPFVHEPRVISYWLGVLKSLADPASYRRQIAGASGIGRPDWWLGPRGELDDRIEDEELERWLGAERLGHVAAACQGQVELVYEQLAELEGIDAPRFFVEKLRPGSDAGLVRELYPSSKEVFLVRDLRDALCSMRSYGQAKGLRAWDLDRPEQLERRIRGLAATARSLAADWRGRSEDRLLVRYEDLALDPRETLAKIFAYLRVGDEGEARAAVEASRDDPGMSQHRTTDSAEASIGRWRKELSGRPLELAQELFADVLETFGYGSDG
jgi:Sulfotransferase family